MELKKEGKCRRLLGRELSKLVENIETTQQACDSVSIREQILLRILSDHLISLPSNSWGLIVGRAAIGRSTESFTRKILLPSCKNKVGVKGKDCDEARDTVSQ